MSNTPAVNDSPIRPSGVSSTMTPPSSGSSFSTGSLTTTGGGAFSGGATYTAYGTMRAANGLYYNAGSATFTMPSGRPSNFFWTYAGIHPTTGLIVSGASKVSEYGFYLHNNEWSTFCDKVNLFRAYKGLGSYPFTTVSSNMLFYNWIFNEGVFAITPMSPPIPPPSTVPSGQIIYANYLNGLMNSLNSIP